VFDADVAWIKDVDVMKYLSGRVKQESTEAMQACGSPTAAASLLQDAHLQCAAADRTDATNHAQTAVKLCQTIYGWHDPRTWKAMTSAARAHEQAGQFDVAVMVARRTMSLVEQWRGRFAPVTAMAQKHLGVMLIRNGQTQEAIRMFSSLLSEFCTTRLAKRSGTAALRGLLAKAYMHQHSWVQV
jgi:hypothetical protein